MIDFKYHLVSLISVFMALAIGVVLGAGPLQESIGNSLAEQVSALRSEKDALQASSRSQQDLIDDYDTYFTAATDELVVGRLRGGRVTLVRLDGAAGADVKAARRTITASGASIGGEVTISPDWMDPSKAQDRNRAGAALARVVGEAAPTGDALGLLNRVLGESLGVPQVKQVGSVRPHGAEALESLRGSGMISFTGNPSHRSDAVVILAGPHNVLTDADSEETAADDQTMKNSLSLVAAIDRADLATVVAGPRRSKEITSLVATLRADRGISQAVSGVDDIDHAMGQVSLVAVVRARLAGRVEQVGTAGDARSLVPDAITDTANPRPSASTNR